jgi:hypothetical protein
MLEAFRKKTHKFNSYALQADGYWEVTELVDIYTSTKLDYDKRYVQ